MHPHRVVAVLLVAAVLLAGCQSGRRAENPQQPAGSAVTPPPMSETNATSAPDPPEDQNMGLFEIRNERAFYWAINRSLGDVALVVHLEAGDANSCEYRQSSQARVASQGTTSVSIFEEGDQQGPGNQEGLGYSYMESFGAPASVRIKDVSASAGQSPVTDMDRVGSLASLKHEFTGGWNFTLLGRGVQPTGKNFFGTTALAFQIECDAPFRSLSARLSQEVSFYGLADVPGAVGAQTVLGTVGTAQLKRTIKAPEAHARFAVSGFCAQVVGCTLLQGTVEVTTPNGTQEYDYATARVLHALGPPGEYSLTSTGFTLRGDHWVAVYGLDRPIDLSEGRQTASIVPAS